MQVGIDIVQISEFKNRLEKSGGLEKVFTEHELAQNKSQDSLAGIFAAKEAFFKALGARPDWLDVWVEKDSDGKPVINCDLLKDNQKASLSISHSGDYSVAVVVIQYEPTNNTNTANESGSEPTNNANATNEKEIIYKELSYKIVGLLYKVHDELGRNAREKHYGDLLEKLLKENGVNYEREKSISKTGGDKNKADFVIDDSIVVELKAKPGFSKLDYYQLKRYLEFANLKLGILVNFSHKYLYPKRIINSNYEE